MWASSVHAGRFDGAVVEESGYGFDCGDPDFPCRLIDGTIAPVPWQDGDKQGVFAMYRPDGAPFELDSWHILESVLARFAADGVRVVLATEFEFYLVNETLTEPVGEPGVSDLYSVDEINRCRPFLDALTAAAQAQALPIGNIISEYGAGQWEVNLRHTDAARACLDGLLLRRAVRACAASFNHQASFMAKPFSGSSGSGMHIHLSLWKDGKNLFVSESCLLNAVAGALAVCSEGMAFYAPYDNSYRRFVPGTYTPMRAGWGRENRAAAIRVPMAGGDSEHRLEFRVCGADANPLLAAAALLSGVHWGVSENLSPPEPQSGAAQDNTLPLPIVWSEALDTLASATVLPRYLSTDFLRHYRIIKENEWRHHRLYVSDYDRRYYGRVV